MKKCNGCGLIKTFEELVKNKTCSNGVRPFCKLCKEAKDRGTRRGKRRGDPEVLRRRVSEWTRKNPEKKQIARIAYRVRKYNAEGSFTLAEWRAILEKYGNVCLSCGSGDVTIDHVVPLSKGGKNTADNLQPLCGPCNSSKNNKTVDYR